MAVQRLDAIAEGRHVRGGELEPLRFDAGGAERPLVGDHRPASAPVAGGRFRAARPASARRTFAAATVARRCAPALRFGIGIKSRTMSPGFNRVGTSSNINV